MKAFRPTLKMAVVLLAAGLFTGCESTDGGSSASGGMYYGTGFSDPWYYGGYDNDVDIIVTPPGLHPEHPIARPMPAPRPMPMPAIPMGARPMPRGR